MDKEIEDIIDWYFEAVERVRWAAAETWKDYLLSPLLKALQKRQPWIQFGYSQKSGNDIILVIKDDEGKSLVVMLLQIDPMIKQLLYYNDETKYVPVTGVDMLVSIIVRAKSKEIQQKLVGKA